MEDRFKFRAWDLDQKQFTYFHLGETQSPAPWDMDYINQCTGLKDKNGKLIFESDIVSYLMYEGPKFEKSIVRWNPGAASFLFFSATDPDYPYGTQIDRRCEIIGNIYEQPELLKDK